MRINSKRKTILGVVIALLAILLFWLGIRFIDEHNLLDEQYGDTGDWGDVDEDIDLTIGDVNYLSDGLDPGGRRDPPHRDTPH